MMLNAFVLTRTPLARSGGWPLSLMFIVDCW